MFNFITKSSLKQIDSFPILPRRLKSVWSDFNYIMAVFFPFVMLFMIPAMIIPIEISDTESSIDIKLASFMIPFSFMIFSMLNKDFFSGRSVAKRTYGYQIIDNQSREVATEMQCLLRNLTLFIWPLEVVILLFSSQRRLGDLIAKTRVIDKEPIDSETILKDFKDFNMMGNQSNVIILTVLVTLIFILLSFYISFS